MEASQYVVVGAGLAGAATAWSLAQQGHEVTVVERAQPAANDGSSHGSARIFRYTYSDPLYTRLVVQSRNRWDELERISGRSLIIQTGSLDFGVARKPQALAGLLEAEGIEHELVSLEEARSCWPQITVDTEVCGAEKVVVAARRVGCPTCLPAYPCPPTHLRGCHRFR